MIEKIVLSGGSSVLPNLGSYLEQMINAKVIIGNPWSRIKYPVELEPTLKNLGPMLATATGLAMRDL